MQLVQELRKPPTGERRGPFVCLTRVRAESLGARLRNRFVAHAYTTKRSTMRRLLTSGLLVAAGLRPSTRLYAKRIFRGPETPTRETREANAALAEAGDLLNKGDGEAAIHALVMHADA